MKPRHPREQVSEEPPNIPQERAFAFYAPQLLEERQNVNTSESESFLRAS
jgi:hypothetical protein